MARRKDVVKREPAADWKYNSVLVSKFINGLMRQGKKSTAERIFYKALDLIEEQSSQEPLPVFEKAIKVVRPVVHVKSRRVGGSTYQVPVEVKSKRAQALAIRWLVDSARKRKDKLMSDKIFNELFDAYEKKGAAVKKREDVHKMAESNKAFAHFRW